MTDPVKKRSPLELLTARFLCFAAVFLVSLVLCPLLAVSAHRILPRIVTNWLFFWPQVATAPYGFIVGGDVTCPLLEGGPNFVLAGIFWIVVGLALTWLLRKRSFATVLIAALPVSFVAATVMMLVLAQLGVVIYVEGP